MKTLNYTPPQILNTDFDLTLESGNDNYDIVVFSHLRWEFVYQRPQHIISRLAKTYRVLFIEEPLGADPAEQRSANLRIISDNLHVLQPKTGSIAEIAFLLPEYVTDRSVKVCWFYSPAFIHLLEYFICETVVYDCMDELTLFRGAENSLAQQEARLLGYADLVFTGGKSLYEAKRMLHPNVHCFPSSVDRQHFARAMNELDLPDDIAGIPAPIAGYLGVIDERIDYNLLEETARLNPDISFVLIGPFAKINEAELPKLPNIHYLGMKPYSALPNYLKAFSVAIMPFAMNDATRFISPTKTLEYIAAGKPVISTPVRDVVRDYSHCISIVATVREFTDALRSALARSPDALAGDYEKILDATSWDSTVHRMKALVSLEVVA